MHCKKAFSTPLFSASTIPNLGPVSSVLLVRKKALILSTKIFTQCKFHLPATALQATLSYWFVNLTSRIGTEIEGDMLNRQ